MNCVLEGMVKQAYLVLPPRVLFSIVQCCRDVMCCRGTLQWSFGIQNFASAVFQASLPPLIPGSITVMHTETASLQKYSFDNISLWAVSFTGVAL